MLNNDNGNRKVGTQLREQRGKGIGATGRHSNHDNTDPTDRTDLADPASLANQR